VSVESEISESLADRYGLPVLTCRLHTVPGAESSDDVAVSLMLRLGQELLAPPLVMTTEEMRLPPTIEKVAVATGVLGVQIPPWVADELRAAAPYLPAGEPVWLELASPVGHLAAVPWEYLLRPIIGAPILRLPSSPVRPMLTKSGIDVAICGVEGRRDAPYDLMATVRSVIGQIAKALPDETTIHVFLRDEAQRREIDALRGQLPRLHVPDPAGLADQISPESAVASGSPPTGIPGQLDNPWLRWMMEAVRPDPVDLVHFVAPGYLSGSYGALDLGPPPVDALADKAVRIVTAGQLVSFLNRAGTWGAVFTIPTKRGWPAGIRLLAHRVNEECPVPVMIDAPHHGDPIAHDDLTDGYRLLFTDDPVVRIPDTPALNLYAHPTRIPRPAGTPVATVVFQDQLNRYVMDRTLGGSTSEKMLAEGQAPLWLAANQRSLERWAAAALDLSLDPSADEATSQGVADALSFISSLFDNPQPPKIP
jgi:hypothetical protein